MGYMQHHSIIVTSWDEKSINRAHAKANDIGLLTTNIQEGAVNTYYTFCIVPDGSKEGWDTSIEFDGKRQSLKDWLHNQRYEDNSSVFDWVEVQFSDDNLETKIIEDDQKYLRCKDA